ETKSPYFSPKKTRNFTKQQGLSLLQKVAHSSKSADQKHHGTKTTHTAKAKDASGSKSTTDVTSKAACKSRKRNIRSDAVLSTAVAAVEPITDPQPLNEKTPTKQDPQEHNTLLDRAIKQEIVVETKCAIENDPVAAEVKIKVEPADEYEKFIEQTPASLDDNTGKEIKWEPKNWRQMMENIREMRRAHVAPVDMMGCDQFTSDGENATPERIKRYHCLVSLMLSSQTKDQANHECMLRLKKHGLTPESIVQTDVSVLEKLIYPVSFYKNKSKFIKNMSQIVIDQYDGDIPKDIEGLLKLPGVGKKMAHLCMRSAWNIVTGIGVDTHVHRISNWLQWVPKETKTPEDTRVALEKWLPFEHWEEVNHMLVGFGQTICTSTFPRCNDCLNAPICPARGKHGIRKTPIKKEIKPENLEF
uniref:Endonuclease III homolog n=1 Tax=Anopheles atroparvus TaxID=41427 RepID=A0A182JL12_ANOAO